MDPETNMYWGLTFHYFKLMPLYHSTMFEDFEPYDKTPNSVMIQIKNITHPLRGWPTNEQGEFYITFNKNNIFNQKWKTVFLEPNLVAVKAEADTNLCITYIRYRKQFDLLPCRTTEAYKDQKFAITDYHGFWDRREANENNSGAWGTSITSLPRGFGYEDNRHSSYYYDY